MLQTLISRILKKVLILFLMVFLLLLWRRYFDLNLILTPPFLLTAKICIIVWIFLSKLPQLIMAFPQIVLSNYSIFRGDNFEREQEMYKCVLAFTKFLNANCELLIFSWWQYCNILGLSIPQYLVKRSLRKRWTVNWASQQVWTIRGFTPNNEKVGAWLL